MTELERPQGALLVLRKALEVVTQEAADFEADKTRAEDAVKNANCAAQQALTSTDELAQQIRDEIERKAKVEALRELGARLAANDESVSWNINDMLDELEGKKV